MFRVNVFSSQPAGSDALEEAIGRLSKKPGVKATIVLDRASGAIMKTSGQVSSIRANKPTASLSTQTSSFGTETSLQPPPSESDGAEEIASIVWNFVGTAGSLVEELDTEVRRVTRNHNHNGGGRFWSQGTARTISRDRRDPGLTSTTAF